MMLEISLNPDAIHWNNGLLIFWITLPMLCQTEWLQPLHWSLLQLSWAGDKPQMSTSRHLRKFRGLSPSMQKRCPLGLCCCKSLDYISLQPIVSDPRCENSPGLRQKLVWHQILLRACPMVKTNRFNQGWYDFPPQAASWKELPPWIIWTFFFLTDSIEWGMSSIHWDSDEIQLKIWSSC